MLNLFRRREEGRTTPPAGQPGAVLASHILAKFLKRLRAMQRPHLLDLGRVSGANIEFFAQAGCKVRVEDLLNGPGDPPAGTPRSAVESDAGSALEGPSSGITAPIRSAAAPMPSRVAGSAADETGRRETGAASSGPATLGVAPTAEAGRTLPRPGSRPSRRIVLPPRTFPKNGMGPGASSETRKGALPVGDLPGVGPPRQAPERCGLPAEFPFPDASFDAVVAWDIFNYYDPETARAVALETRRILKPGGLLLAYFYAARARGPESPGRYRIQDERQIACDHLSDRLMLRHVFQNRDIEKMFAGLRIIELYFLRNSMREILMEKRLAGAASSVKPRVVSAPPRPRFTIE